MKHRVTRNKKRARKPRPRVLPADRLRARVEQLDRKCQRMIKSLDTLRLLLARLAVKQVPGQPAVGVDAVLTAARAVAAYAWVYWNADDMFVIEDLEVPVGGPEGLAQVLLDNAKLYAKVNDWLTRQHGAARQTLAWAFENLDRHWAGKGRT